MIDQLGDGVRLLDDTERQILWDRQFGEQPSVLAVCKGQIQKPTQRIYGSR